MYNSKFIFHFLFLAISCNLFFSCKSVSDLKPIPNFSIDYDKNEIDKTDKEIVNLVYALYGN